MRTVEAARVRVGDLDVEYEERGAGEPVVFVHGNWGSRVWWEPVLARVPAGVRAIAYDLRGRGGTRGPTTDVTVAALACDLGALADALSLRRFRIAGHSFGSAIAMEFALHSDERLRALALVSPPWVDGMPQAYAVPEHQERLAADRAYSDQALRAVTPDAPRDALWERLVDASRAQSRETAIATMDTLVAWAPGDRLREVSCPSTVIVGALDPLTTVEVARRAAEALGAALVVMPGTGHGPMLGAPDEFAKVLWEALAP